MSGNVVATVDGAVRAALHGRHVLLAVSGGIDSMVLMSAAARVAHKSVVAVATFDHGTGRSATRAASLVRATAEALGFRCISARSQQALKGEAALRSARWEFLADTAAALSDTDAGELDVVVATAHSLDDQIETVVMRVMRGASAYGLAGLYARSRTVRPLISVGRAVIEKYAAAVGARHVEDPSNGARLYFRNRVRLDLLPALQRVDPDFGNAMLEISRSAAALRDQMEGSAASLVYKRYSSGRVAVDLSPLGGHNAREIATLLPAIVARAGVRIDRRGVVRLAEFVSSTLLPVSGQRGRVQLSGGFEAEWVKGLLHFTAPGLLEHRYAEDVPLAHGLTLGPFRFRVAANADDESPWRLALPASAQARVRLWRPGDRLIARGGGAPRRVKRFLSDAGVTGTRRAEWPVVLAGDQLVWIPGIRRGAALPAGASERYIYWKCENDDD